MLAHASVEALCDGAQASSARRPKERAVLILAVSYQPLAFSHFDFQHLQLSTNAGF